VEQAVRQKVMQKTIEMDLMALFMVFLKKLSVGVWMIVDLNHLPQS